MKLLGRLQRGPKRSDKIDCKQKPAKVCGPGNPLVSNATSNKSIISIPQDYDDNTIDANTLFEWSVADNASSVGSVAELFHTQNDGRSKKKRRNVNKTDGDASSSDEEEDDLDDDDENNLHSFQYCKLSDSPPHKGSQGQQSVENTPVRKGGGLFQRNSNLGTPTRDDINGNGKLASPSQIKTRNERENSKSKYFLSFPVQMRRTESSISGPVDVDSFMEEEEVEVTMTTTGDTRVVATSKKSKIVDRQLPAELKGRIHAVNFDDDNDILESSYDESNKSSSPSSESSVDNASIQNVGNANSPIRTVTRKGNMEALTCFASTRNLGDTNIGSTNMFQKELSSSEPEFTFSISEEDTFGSDADSMVATAWLLHDGDGPNLSNFASGDKLQKKRQWELDRLQIDINRGSASSRSFLTEAAVDGDADTPTSVDESISSTGSKGFRKMKNKFQSIVKKKNKGHSSVSSDKNSARKKEDTSLKSNRVDRLKLHRDRSELSMAPLTGIEEQNRNLLGLNRRDKELSKEVERRKEIERRDIERHQQERRKKLDHEKLEMQRMREAEKWRAGGYSDGNNTTGVLAISPSESVDRLKNKKSLQSWVQGITNNGSMENSIQDSNLKNVSTGHLPYHQYSQHLAQGAQQSYLPAVYDAQSATTGKSSLTCSTARIDNRAKPNVNMSNITTSTYDFDPQFPDEDSTALTPEASAPITHDFSCVLCKSGERTHLAVPCMHFSFCGECVSKLEQQQHVYGSMRCTVCNKDTTKFSKVFY